MQHFIREGTVFFAQQSFNWALGLKFLLLLLLYFRKIREVSTAASALFADDTLVYRCDCCGSDECCCIRSNLSKISEWAVDNKVLFNAAISAHMHLGAATSPPAALSGVDLPRVESKCHLGVVLSSDLRWDAHVSRSLKQTAGYVSLLMNLAYRHRMPSDPTILLCPYPSATRVLQCCLGWMFTAPAMTS